MHSSSVLTPGQPYFIDIPTQHWIILKWILTISHKYFCMELHFLNVTTPISHVPLDTITNPVSRIPQCLHAVQQHDLPLRVWQEEMLGGAVKVSRKPLAVLFWLHQLVFWVVAEADKFWSWGLQRALKEQFQEGKGVKLHGPHLSQQVQKEWEHQIYCLYALTSGSFWDSVPTSCTVLIPSSMPKASATPSILSLHEGELTCVLASLYGVSTTTLASFKAPISHPWADLGRSTSHTGLLQEGASWT